MQSNDFEDEDYSPAPSTSRASHNAATASLEEMVLPFSVAGMRLDAALAELFPHISRSRLATLIRAGEVTLNGEAATPKQRVTGSEQLRLRVPPREDERAFTPEDVALDVVYQDDDVVVIDKPPGLVVHPGAGNWSGTLLNGLLFHFPQTQHVPRAGIVHRLDKDTSGLMMVALNEAAQLQLVRQLQARTVSRTYAALVRGLLDDNGSVDAPIGRHSRDRLKMAVVGGGAGKPAVTHYRVEEQFRFHSLLECKLETGRTHQIRVHMAHIGFPIEADAVYGKGLKGLNVALHEVVSKFGRQALHAKALAFAHPRTQKMVAVTSALPDDLANLIDAVASV
jgi:23S rRNA pseudouridine1911/1915/1917 synthase